MNATRGIGLGLLLLLAGTPRALFGADPVPTAVDPSTVNSAVPIPTAATPTAATPTAATPTAATPTAATPTAATPTAATPTAATPTAATPTAATPTAAKNPPKASGAASGVEMPAPVPIERYQLMIEKSLFALATQAAPPPPPPVETAAFSKDLVLTGVARLEGGEFVSIVSRDQTQRFGLMTGESYNGISVASIAWSDAVGKTKVTLKQGSEFGVIGFDEANLASGSGSDLPPGVIPPNGQPPLPPGVTAPAGGVVSRPSQPARTPAPVLRRRNNIIPAVPR